ncbi:MAG: hypothetical protein IE916_04155 [Epsilonproteobacteria bacterium]|nr:hypothetical protein [Campylobacterota bacterium]
MTRLLFASSILLLLSGCVNKHGVSLKYYSNCKEYYDMQGYYHKECGEDDIVTYDEMKEIFQAPKEEPKGNVW